MKFDSFDDVLAQWQVPKPNYTEKEIIARLKRKRHKNIIRNFSFGLAACIILAGSFVFMSETKNDTQIFDGSNSDYVCYTILMDANYE